LGAVAVLLLSLSGIISHLIGRETIPEILSGAQFSEQDL